MRTHILGGADFGLGRWNWWLLLPGAKVLRVEPSAAYTALSKEAT